MTDLAIGTALQLRMLGGALGIAVANSVLNVYVRSHLSSVSHGPGSDLSAQSILADVAPAARALVRQMFGEGYNLQMRVTIAFCGAQFLSILLVWKKVPLRLNNEASIPPEQIELDSA